MPIFSATKPYRLLLMRAGSLLVLLATAVLVCAFLYSGARYLTRARLPTNLLLALMDTLTAVALVLALGLLPLAGCLFLLAGRGLITRLLIATPWLALPGWILSQSTSSQTLAVAALMSSPLLWAEGMHRCALDLGLSEWNRFRRAQMAILVHGPLAALAFGISGSLESATWFWAVLAGSAALVTMTVYLCLGCLEIWNLNQVMKPVPKPEAIKTRELVPITLVTNLQLSGRTVVVLGANGLLSLSCARYFLEQGAEVAMISKNSKALEKATRGVKGLREGCLFYEADVSQPGLLEKTLVQLQDELGRLDCVLLIGADNASESLLDWSEQAMQTSLLELRLQQQAARVLVRQPLDHHGSRGCLVNVHSPEGFHPALETWTRELAGELVDKGVRVNGVRSYLQGIRDVDRRPQTVDECEELAKLAALLASPRTSNLTGQTLPAGRPGRPA